MAAPGHGEDSDDAMDEFMEKFKKEKYKNAFNESNWEEVRTFMIVKKNPVNSMSLLKINVAEDQTVCCNIAFSCQSLLLLLYI